MPRERQLQRVVVIGAGVTGLTTAWKLRKEGHTVTVIERSDRADGCIQSMRMGEWLVEAGPNTMLLNDQKLLDFFDGIGLGEELLVAAPEAKNRFIVRDGRPVAAPMSLLQFLRTPLLSGGAKWRLFREPFIRPAKPGVEESVAQFARRRLGAEVVDYAINPLIGGIYAGDPEKLSVRYAFPMLHRFDHDHGSLLSGARAARRARKESGEKCFKSRSISFTRGLQMIIDALVHQVGDSLFTRATITAIEGPVTPPVEGSASTWRVRYERNGEGPAEVETDRVIVAIPGHAAAQLPMAVDGPHPLRELAEIKYPPVTCVALGFLREQVRHPLDGYGVLVPAREGFHILGTLFSSSLFPGRAPAGHVLLSTFLGGMRQPELAGRSHPELCALILEDLGKLLSVSDQPVFAKVTAWERAIPQYNLGYERFHRAMEQAEAGYPGLVVGGHIRDGVSVGDCIRAGMKLAGRATGSLSAQHTGEPAGGGSSYR